ncbi:MAG: SIMPL domain-containing protein, partial [Candidatus Omnitrophica bacterium]|nr:SIMPL domain-containing protein [Candidatus Omnitrophota bacterium]
MEGLKVLRSTQIIILGICFVIATIASTVIFSNGLLQIRKFSSEVITVTGSAEKKIVSDYIVWKGEFSRRAPELKSAYVMLQEDLTKVKEYLTSQGVEDYELVILPVNTKVLYK